MGLETAAIVGIGSLALSAAGTGGSFIQAGKQRRAQAKAQSEAAKAVDEAKKTLSINYMKALGIQKEPYELQREAMLASGAQATEAARESERGVAATAGRIQMAQNEAQAGIRTAMGQEMQDIDKLVANEEARLAGLRANISLQEAMGAQEAAAYAQNARNQAMAQGMAGLQAMGQQAQNMIKLYPEQAAPSTDVSKYSAGTPGQPANYVQQTQPAYTTPLIESGRQFFNPFGYQANPNFRFYQNTPQLNQTPSLVNNPYFFEFK